MKIPKHKAETSYGNAGGSDPEHADGKLKLKLSALMAADQKAVDPVVVSVMKAVREADCLHSRLSSVELSLAEALANAVVHGAKSDSSKVIECDVLVDHGCKVIIVVRDPGPGFNPANVPNPLAGENLMSSHGRGIYLINQLMDEVKFSKNGSEIQMIVG